MRNIENAENVQINNDAQTVADLAVQAADIRHINGHPFVVLAEGQNIASLEHLLATPMRKQGSIVVQDQNSFIAVFRRHADEDTSIYADREKGTFRAVFNDSINSPGWNDHYCSYTCPKSNEWQIWTKNDGRRMTQAEFALFIEQNLVDIIEPVRADMLEISRTLQAKKKASFSSSIRLSDGSHQFSYEEDIRGTTTNGKLEIPETFKLGLPVFLNGQAYEIEARLRYRINKENQLEMWYELIRSYDIHEDAFNGVHEAISEETGQYIINAVI